MFKCKKRLTMQDIFMGYKSSMNISVQSILFGILIFLVDPSVRILEPPARWFLAILFIVAGVGKLLSIKFKSNKGRIFFLLLLVVLWTIVTWIYAVSDILSIDWILTGGVVAHLFTLAYKYKGDIKDV